MTPIHQNADSRFQAPRWRVGGWWGAPTWGLTRETVWCQKSVAGRAGNHDRRQSQDASVHCTTDNGAKVIRPGAGRKTVFAAQQGGPRPRQPHKLDEGGFDFRPCSHFGASASPAFASSQRTGTVCAAYFTRVLQPPHGDQLAGDVSGGIGRMRNRALAAQPPKRGGSSRYARPEPTGADSFSSTPSVSCGGFIPGLSARVVVWFIGVEVFLSVVVPSGPFGGVCVATPDAPGVGGLADAGRLLFHGAIPWLKRTWRKSPTKRSRKCRECPQPQPSPFNPTSPSLPPAGPALRSTPGAICATVIRSSCPRRPRSSSRRLPAPPESGTGSERASPKSSRTAFRACGVGGCRVGESTGLPRREAWGALSGHTGQRSLGLCWRDRQGRSVTRRPAILKNKTEVGQAWAGAPTVGPGNRGADAIESLSANQGSRSERNASDVSDAYWVRTGRNADEKHALFLCRGDV